MGMIDARRWSLQCVRFLEFDDNAFMLRSMKSTKIWIMNLSTERSTSAPVTNSTRGLTLALVSNFTWHSPSRLTTLEDSLNSSLSSYLFSATTQEYVSIFGTSTQPHLTSPDVSNRTSLNQPRTSYDSKGAAYYICSVILVYALAIVLLVISLARRKRKDQYQPASQRSNGDDYYVKAGQPLGPDDNSNDSNRWDWLSSNCWWFSPSPLILGNNHIRTIFYVEWAKTADYYKGRCLFKIWS